MDKIKLDSVPVAQTDKTYTVEIPIEVLNGDDKPHLQKVPVIYKPVTPEVLAKSGLAPQLAAIIVDWGFEEPPTLEVLQKRPLPFLQQISDGVMADFFPEKQN